ncbi:hypothetical protein QNO08_08575 [Arthrobacter sp. zg-Y820]|uniref:hypothetical protein n=1 Tax=unclassified Arthrobacter TaxID=235627 RepID=UPI001E2D8A31|nr:MULTISPECIES: hypothetical protein [unclassified Arthrobacter]MCC9196829.1 hypothetical protein [Arthrobacter sp. zg-Y820]MDK1279692.1 hypothetical protein [Arthrobacter sp. zg.Y820]WIB07939.1 hypothetical protein QNO08_08575 [Arthrobacter sp. zg-Y820]
MLADLAFFSFVELTDASSHGAYNRWHQLDHRPENLALPGVAWGDRWARVADPEAALSRGSAAGRTGSTTGANSPKGADALAGTDYVAMYWFRSPAEESVTAWNNLGEASFQWGRGPIIPGVRRPLLGFFRPVKGYAAPRVLVDPDVLPYRPNRGLHLTLTRYAEPHGLDTHSSFTWEDTRLIPELLNVDGVAGAWTFSFSHPQQHGTLPFTATFAEPPGGLRIRMLYLDEDPGTTAESVRKAERRLETAPDAPRDVGEVLFSSPLSTIIPWQDW